MQKFQDAKSMLEYIQAGNDIYSPTACTYVYCYNDYDSICVYSLDPEYAAGLAEKCANDDNFDYWCELLHSHTGYIYDDPSCDGSDLIYQSNLHTCEGLVAFCDWIDCKDYLDAIQRTGVQP